MGSVDISTVEFQGEIRQTTVDIQTNEGGKRLFRALRDGSISTADYFNAMILAGYGRVASVGTATTPITFKTGFTAAQPELDIDVPGGTAVMPMYIMVYLETSAGTINEVVFQTGDNSVGAGTSTAITAGNLINGVTKGDGAGSPTVRSAYSASGTAPTNTVEFWRRGYPFVDATGNPEKTYEWFGRLHPIVLVVGTGCLVGYVGGTTTAPTGYIKVEYLAFPASFTT